MELVDLWFLVIAFLWTGYFILEGFDFGVGALLPVLGRRPADRRVMLGTIGPVWDGNEVWLIVAAGATFAAFPEWYATMLSGFYLLFLPILLALIVRGVALEFRGKRDDPHWRRRWDVGIAAGSAVPAFLWGVVLADLVRGVPLDADGEFAGTVLDLIGPYALLGGLATVSLFALHGAVFTTLKTAGPIREAARTLAVRLAPVAVIAAAAFLAWTAASHGDRPSTAVSILAVLALAGAVVALRAGRDGLSFAGTAASIGLLVAALFTALFPHVLPSSTGGGLTVHNAAATPYTLTVLTVVAAVFTPLVLLYQGWTYWVFRRRLTATRTPGE